MAQPTSTPKFQIDQVVYIVVSASGRGFLESYTIDNISFDRTTGKWVYTINIAKAPSAGVLVGTRNQLGRDRTLYFSEGELTDYCTALGLIVDYHTRALAKYTSLREACGGTG